MAIAFSSVPEAHIYRFVSYYDVLHSGMLNVNQIKYHFIHMTSVITESTSQLNSQRWFVLRDFFFMACECKGDSDRHV
jgi:hypothetical protein